MATSTLTIASNKQDDGLTVCQQCQNFDNDLRPLSCHHIFCLGCIDHFADDQDLFKCPVCDLHVNISEHRAQGDAKAAKIRARAIKLMQELRNGPFDQEKAWMAEQYLSVQPDLGPIPPRFFEDWSRKPSEEVWPTAISLGLGPICGLSKDYNGKTTLENGANGMTALPMLTSMSSTLNSVQTSPATIFCGCDDGQNVVTSKCCDCDDHLCDFCVDAHKRVKLTQKHVIVKLKATPVTTAAQMPISRPRRISGTSMSGTPPPVADVMQVYANVVESSKSESNHLLVRTKQVLAMIEEARKRVISTEEQIESKTSLVHSDVAKNANTFIEAIKNRETVIVTRLYEIRDCKLKVLAEQRRLLDQAVFNLRQAVEHLSNSIATGKDIDLVNSCTNANNVLNETQKLCGNLAVREDDTMHFDPPNPELLLSISKFGSVVGSCFAGTSTFDGENLNRAYVGKETKFYVVLRDQLNEPRTTGGDEIKVHILDPEQRLVRHAQQDLQNGRYCVTWYPTTEGPHSVSVTLKDQHIKESPINVTVRHSRNYNDIGSPLFSFGREGSEDGNLCRPWGICCSKEGLIIVANRSNNRIEVFASGGVFLRNFGSTGNAPGQFDRPSSVCCDSKDRVVVVDKDNHRIQIFTIEGKFLSTFGSKGSKPGQFNYPWDVATNSKDQIVVSDTRNHRLQLFSPDGEFLKKFGFDGPNWKCFDSPRGVCFRPDGQVIVTDFNNHRILVVDMISQKGQSLGQEGNEDGMFLRPNGVTIDDEGNFLVADSRNDRIQVFCSRGVFLKKFGMSGKDVGQFDRPSGIAISPDGLIYVVDFGNNRIQVF